MHLAVRRLSAAELKGVSLRPARAGDRPFLAALYATTRADELARTEWDDEQKAWFCDFQFRAQQADYAARFPAEGHKLILRDDEPVGRVWVAPQESHLLLVDIAILPEHQGMGIGSAVVGEIVSGAGKPVRATARLANARARSFYERLGFTLIAEDEVNALYERS